MVTDRTPRRPVAALFAGCDAAGIAACSLFAALVAPPAAGAPARLAAATLLALGLIAGVHGAGVYTRSRRRIVPLACDDLVALAGGLAGGAVVLTALHGLAPEATSRLYLPGSPLWVAGGAAVLLPLLRAAALRVTRSRRSPTRVLVLGTGHVAREIGTRLARTGQVVVVGHVDDQPLTGAPLAPVLGRLSTLGQRCEELAVDRVVVAFSRSHPAEAAEALRTLPSRVAVDIVPRYFEITGWQATLDDVSGLTLLSLGDRLQRRRARFVKRSLDVAVALVGLLLSLPLLSLAVVAIRLESPGPLLFRQERLGRGRAPFWINKLRTMIPITDDHAQPTPSRLPGAHEDDPRITPLARLVRRLCVDELPQLLNVLRGDMSLVGPRPLVPEECMAVDARVDRRFDVRPGMTGLWQVCGQHDLSFDELCRLDYQYATSWSLSTDLRVLARTPARLMRGAGGAPPAPVATVATLPSRSRRAGVAASQPASAGSRRRRRDGRPPRPLPASPASTLQVSGNNLPESDQLVVAGLDLGEAPAIEADLARPRADGHVAPSIPDCARGRRR